ncbi:MAG: translation initiation factor IF-6 [Candidatus Micrarchaeales archaeon]|jgi:translation initiation factor 6|uniref:Translation initiation factor 6 n=1 Tax=Candidatus Micrarchaeum acidiphilum ARMAN-2 TaxID=425595 RepID=C7DIM5_MICA2|nr:MAG: translation initiation factor eIF-6 [Candidatus Micrarchaeum acidiphilum ARMAN-2]MCW6161055.1 translation initiation factor IF-6 [Candidatus Micrarchaeales archaeon]
MGAAKLRINGSDYVGAFITATDDYAFIGNATTPKSMDIISEILGVSPVRLSVFSSDLIGIFSRANSNGIVLSSMITASELESLKSKGLGINVAVLDSSLNAIGNNLLANDKFAIVNPEYSKPEIKEIGDTLGVETIPIEIGGFKTPGANNILTNKGLVVNNRCSDEEKERLDEILGFDSVRTTSNMGSLSIGISTVANSKGAIVGETATGYEFGRIIDALHIE